MSSVPDLDLARIRAFCEARVPAHVRSEVRVEHSLRGKSVSIFECRPPWHDGLSEWSRMPIAQLRYNPERCLWTLYWADRNGRWHLYDMIEPDTSDRLLQELSEDPTCIFWG
jgi:hypothetical protein